MRRGLLILFLLLVLPLAAHSQTTPPIHFTAAVTPAPARPGEVATVTVKATVEGDWHVYSVTPAPGGPAATEITAANGWQSVGPTTEDTPIRTFDPNFKRNVAYHEKTAAFSRQFRVPANAQSGPLSVTLHYQVCNHKLCFPPLDATVNGTTAIEAGAARAAFSRPTVIAAAAPSNPVPNSDLGLFLLTAFGAGLLALITPCVFPLIPITLTSFVKQADGNKRALVRLSFGYALGIVALFVAVGAVASATLGAAGANTIAANPWVNLTEGILFVIFAFSFFEVITLTLPANLSALQGTAKKHGGLGGLVLLGITFVLASFTCTAPFIGSLLVAAAGGQKALPLLGMVVFALAFVSPFFVFGAFPQWIGRIPKSGVWLARAKATLGFIELAAALKYLSAADQVWQWKILTGPVLLAAWAIIFVCAALYLLGILRFGIVADTETDEQRRKIPAARWAFIGVFLFAAFYCFYGLSGRTLNRNVAAFLPPSGYGGAQMAGGDKLAWLSNYNDALAQAKAQHKPLLINFTGWTCTNCRSNENGVFPAPGVQKALDRYVRLELYTDDKTVGPANQKLQLAKFGDLTLPLYGIINPETETVVDKTGGVQSIGSFSQFLSRGLLASAPSAPSNGGAGTLWAAYSPAAVAQASAQGKPVIIDFTAAWCTNCKAIEHDVFEDKTVSPVLGRDFVTLRADLTQWTSPASVALERQYGFGSLPTIVLLDKNGKEIKPLRITGRLSIPDFLKRLQTASGNTATVASR